MKKTLSILCILLIIAAMSGFRVYANTYNQPTELVELRTVNQKVFLLPDGNYEYNYYNSPVHYWDGDCFREFNNSFKINADTFTTTDSNYLVSLPKSMGSNGKISLSYMGIYGMEVIFDDISSKSFFDLCESSLDKIETEDAYNVISNLNGIVNYESRSRRISYEQTVEGLMHYLEINKPVNSF